MPEEERKAPSPLLGRFNMSKSEETENSIRKLQNVRLKDRLLIFGNNEAVEV